MSKRETRFKKLNDDSKILGISSLFRDLTKKPWAINVDFNGGSSQSMKFSNIPVLVRKRVLNPTKQYKLPGSPIYFKIENAQNWEVAKATDCPAYRAHSHGKDDKELCFVTQVGSTRMFIPQLEMARVLFYHDPFLARLSLQHNALSEDFMLGKSENGTPLIVVREKSEYPVCYFNQDDNRRFLSWVLLDRETRTSFESISIHLISNKYQINNYQYWNFQFKPPPLSGVELEAIGWKDTITKSFFVWEIRKLDKLPSDIADKVDFYHPRFERKISGKPTKGGGKNVEAPEQVELDDDELSDSDKNVMELMSDRVTVTFRKPHITNRITSKTKAVKYVIGNDEKEVLGKDLSPNEKEESGSLPGGAWNNLDDQSDDAHLYFDKFKSFFNMINCLIDEHDFKLVSEEIFKLPQLGKGKKHQLNDSLNPRCLVIVDMEFDDKFYTLLEINTSDGAAKLSTILLNSYSSWVQKNKKEILKKIMKKSLGWPNDYFKEQLDKTLYFRIPHPKAMDSGALSSEDIVVWAQRVYKCIGPSINNPT